MTRDQVVEGLIDLEAIGKLWAMYGWLSARGLLVDRKMIGQDRRALETWGIADKEITAALIEFDAWWLPPSVVVELGIG